MSDFLSVDRDFLSFFFFFDLRHFSWKIKSYKMLMLWFILVFLTLYGDSRSKPRFLETDSVESIMIKVSDHPFFDFMFKFLDIFLFRLFFSFTFSIIMFFKDSQRIIVIITVKLFFGVMSSCVLYKIEILCFTFDILLKLFINLSFFVTGYL